MRSSRIYWGGVQVIDLKLSRKQLYEGVTFLFVFSGLAVSGIPGWSRTMFLFEAILAALTVIDVLINKPSFGKWMLLPLLFLFVALIDGVVLYPSSHALMVRLVGAWVGALLVGEAVRRGVPMSVVINAMIWAAIANAIAAFMGFDAYVVYTATAEQQAYTSILERRSGLTGNANLFAVQAILPLFALLIWGQGVRKLLVIAAVVVAIYALFVTGSRKSLVIFSFLFIAYLSKVWRMKPRLLLTVSLLLLVVPFLVLTSPGLLDNIESFSRQLLAVDRVFEALEGNDNSFMLRMEMVETAKQLFLQNPFLGGGLGFFAETSGFGAYAHNNYWELLVSGGLLLTCLFYLIHLTIILRLLPRLSRKNFEVTAAILLVATLLFDDMAMVTYDQLIVVLLMVLLILWSRGRDVKGMSAAPLPIKRSSQG